MTDIEIGDVVRLKSGGPLMTVITIQTNADGVPTSANCTWFSDNNKPYVEWFPVAALKCRT